MTTARYRGPTKGAHILQGRRNHEPLPLRERLPDIVKIGVRCTRIIPHGEKGWTIQGERGVVYEDRDAVEMELASRAPARPDRRKAGGPKKSCRTAEDFDVPLPSRPWRERWWWKEEVKAYARRIYDLGATQIEIGQILGASKGSVQDWVEKRRIP